jgi:hypothetical protein
VLVSLLPCQIVEAVMPTVFFTWEHLVNIAPFSLGPPTASLSTTTKGGETL